ncbi:MAG: sugar phosphate isomerase/epimerase family protein [Pseudomonadota bacterium]
MLTFAARAKTVEEGLTCLGLGFNLLEITLPCPQGAPEEQGWLGLLDSGKASFLAHGPQEGDPRDPDRLAREYLPRLKAAVAAAARLKCPLLTVHLWLDSRFLGPDAITRKIELLRQTAAWGDEYGVKINIENLSEPWTDMIEAFKQVESLGLTLDLGHGALMQPRNASFGFIENCYHRLRHLHLHDNHGGDSPKSDLHLPPGQGIVPFLELFSLLKKKGYAGTATLELKPGELTQARDWIRATWDAA